MSLDNYAFGIVREQAHEFARDPFMVDGLFGLAFSYSFCQQQQQQQDHQFCSGIT